MIMAYCRAYLRKYAIIEKIFKKLKKVVDKHPYVCYSNKGFKMVRWSSG